MGIWALPDTEEKIEKLKSLMENPIRADGAQDLLYNLLGCDNFFDLIDEIKQEDPESDIRISVFTYLEKYDIDIGLTERDVFPNLGF